MHTTAMAELNVLGNDWQVRVTITQGDDERVFVIPASGQGHAMKIAMAINNGK